MAVAKNDHLEARSRRLQTEFIQIVQHVDRDVVNFQELNQRQQKRPFLCVHVSTDGSHGRQLAQAIEYRWITNVARVEDEIRSPQGSKRFRTKQAVRIGNHADCHLLHNTGR